MRLEGSLAILALVTFAAPFHAQEGVDASEVLAKAKEAAGGAAWDDIRSARSHMKIMTSGLRGTADGWDDLLTGHSLSTYELGVISGEDGFDGRVAWTKFFRSDTAAGGRRRASGRYVCFFNSPEPFSESLLHRRWG